MEATTHLKNIAYAEPVKPDVQTLRGLQTACITQTVGRQIEEVAKEEMKK